MRKVYVVNCNGNKLMPCKPAKARHLLRGGKAKVIKTIPFTIQLLWDCEENVQDVTVGIDKGSHITGYCVTGNKEILMSGYINHRKNIKKKMEARAVNRKGRRSRLWYRKPRFDNRSSSKRHKRLLPSIKANVEEIIRVIKKLPLPIKNVIIEDVLIDVSLLVNKNGCASGGMYENLRLGTLTRDDFTCRWCGVQKVRMEAHHIIPRSDGGKNTIENMITLCTHCHKKVHSGKIDLNICGVSGFKDRIAQRTMQGKTYMYDELSRLYNLGKVFGYQTSFYRKQLGLQKDHDVDALVISILGGGEMVQFNRYNCYNINFRPSQRRKIFYNLPKGGYGRVKCQVNKELGGFQAGDIIKVGGFIKQVRAISSNRLELVRVKGEPYNSVPHKCKLVEKNSSMYFTYF